MNAMVFFRTKLSLWVAVSALFVVAAGYIPIVRSGEERFGYWGCWGVVLRGGAFVGTAADTAMILIFQGGMWGLLLAAVGWIAHRVLLAALPRGTAGHAEVRDSSPPRPSVRPVRRRKVIPAALVAVALVSPFAACVLSWLRTPPLPKTELKYPDGVSFYGGRVAWWFAPDMNNPGLCPLTIHLSGVDLDGAALASPDRLRELGWEVSIVRREDDGKVYSEQARSPGRAVECSYIRGRLANVRVGADGVPIAGQPPESVAVSLGGRRVALPSPYQAIVAALGPPLSEH